MVNIDALQRVLPISGLEAQWVAQGIVDRATLASALKSELRRFFTKEFDSQHWDMGRDEDPEDGYVQTRDRVLGSAWLERA